MKKIALLLLCVAVFLTACASDKPIETEIFAMDTFMQLRIWGESEQLDDVTELIRELDRKLNAHNESSEIFALNRDKNARLSPLTLELLVHAVEYAQATDGAFDPTVFPLVEQWQSATDTVPNPDLRSVGYDNIVISSADVELKSSSSLDLGGIAKGFAAQKSVEFLENTGVTSALLSLGGNVQTLGSKPDGTKWAIGIADPDAPSEHIAIVEFEGSMALVTSGGYQRYYDIGSKRYHHIIDPKTGFPADNELASVTILARNGTMADAYSTALFVMGLEKATEFWEIQNNFEAVFVLKDGSIIATEGAASMLTQCEFTVIKR